MNRRVVCNVDASLWGWDVTFTGGMVVGVSVWRARVLQRNDGCAIFSSNRKSTHACS